MDSTLPQSKSVPSDLAIGRRHRRVSISGSASYQSHLSSLGSLHRVRTTSEQIPLRSVDSEKDYLHMLEDGLAQESPRLRAGRFHLLKQFVTDPVAFVSDDFRRIRNGHVWRPRVLLTLYCCICVLFLTAKIHAFARKALQATQPRHGHPWRPALETGVAWDGTLSSPPLTNITLSQRLSVAFRELSPKAHLDTFVVQARPGHESDLTACLWTEDVRVQEALASAATWPGSVSLVIVTTHAPESTEYAALLDRLAHEPVSTHACVHILYVPSIAGSSANTYLNMARFFSRTSRVVLFPDGIPRSVLSDDAGRWLDKLPVNARHPVLLSNATSRAYSPRVLAPVVLPRDHPTWCTERLYVFGSRALDWDDCLWKLWLESAGEASSMAVPHFLDRPRNASALSVSPYVMKIRLRWSTKYRSEACALTIKRSQALEPLSKTERRHAQWRKKFCRETVGPGSLDVP